MGTIPVVRARRRTCATASLSNAVVMALLAATTFGRPAIDSINPGLATRKTAALDYCIDYHNVGKIVMMTDHYGGFNGNSNGEWVDCFTGESNRAAYPKGSGIEYLYTGELWIGGVLGTDTLVSTSNAYEAGSFPYEFLPVDFPNDRAERRSITPSDSVEGTGAVSEQDIIIAFADTFSTNPLGTGNDYLRRGPHIPLHLLVTRRSYAWSFGYAEDFVLFDCTVKNVGKTAIRDAYFALFVDSDVGYPTEEVSPMYDDLVGFLDDMPAVDGCDFHDTLNLAWCADNDGDPIDGEYQDLGGLYGKSATMVTGTMLLQGVPGHPVSFNWWTNDGMDIQRDFGPRRKPREGEPPIRDFRTGGTGNPLGDANKYYMMSSGEFDYDQAYTGTIQPYDLYWTRPYSSEFGIDVGDGWDGRYVISVGPYNVPPGAEFRVSFAYIAGENFHTDPLNIHRLISGDVRGYYEHLDFSDLAKNAMWAKWIYDNPGVDTDGDGYFGKQRVCVFDSAYVDGQWVPTAAETTFYEGDGVADWRGAAPPPAPTFWLYPGYNSIRVRFNGKLSETTKDIFTGIIDFEGYRIYWGLDERESSLSLLASYDRKNYDKWVFNERKQPEPGFELQDIPLSLEALRCAYGSGMDPCDDTLFDPLDYGDLAHLYYHPQYPDSVFYFTIHDFNGSEFGVTTDIRKIYPEEPEPSNFDTLRPEQLTDDGYVKYYEYEFTIRDLLPSVPYYVNVTAFDFGSPKGGLKALETSKTLGIKHCYPAGTQAIADSLDNRAYVYPNPYRIDDHYRQKGFEGRMREDRPNDRVRLIHFANIPAKCTIRIHSLDGDLVRQIDHDMSPSDPNSSHETWDLITRNTQLVVSGIYYWTVEDDRGQVQMGKLVIIL